MRMSLFFCNFAAIFNHSIMKKSIIIIWGLVCCLCAIAQSQIIGDWQTVDDKTGNHYAVVSIYKGSDGLYYGKISKMLVGDPGLRCIECKGEDTNALLEGLVILRGMSYDAKNNQLVGGKVLDPESGKFYYGKVYPKDGKLVLRGSLDRFGVLGRNQTWER